MNAEQFFTLLAGHMIDVFFLLASVLVLYAVKWIKSKLTAEQQKLLESIATSAVLYVQQTMPDALNDAKLIEAVSSVIELLEAKGITIDENTILLMVEAKLKEIKIEFGDEWQKSTL